MRKKSLVRSHFSALKLSFFTSGRSRVKLKTSGLSAAVTSCFVAFFLCLFSVGSVARAEDPFSGWQCAQFARLFSGIEIFGDAYTWWNKAIGKYGRGSAPEVGAVLVFKPHGAMRLGHVAVVSQVVSDRLILVTHANWSRIGGARGQVEKNVTVEDVSSQGDWSEVKVWNNPTRDIGTTIYPTFGFVYHNTDKGNSLAGLASSVGASPGASSAKPETLAKQDTAKQDSIDPIAKILALVSGGNAGGDSASGH